MKLLARILIGLVIFTTSLVIFFDAAMYVSAWYYRHEAERLLECARGLKPGNISYAEFQDRIRPFRKYLSHGYEGMSGRPEITTDDYGMTNYPPWGLAILRHMPERITEFNVKHLMLYGTAFRVSPRFQNGRLAVLYVREYQDGVDGIHPFIGALNAYDQSAEKGDPHFEYGPFNGYRVGPYIEQNEDSHGNPIGTSWTIREYVDMDGRATEAEKKQAYSFNLACFTDLHGCRDATRILSPAPDRPEP